MAIIWYNSIMKYENIIKGKFISRPNRFIALIDLDGEQVKAHVKNTGRLGELLVPGAEVFLEDHEGRMGTRKLRYSLVGVVKEDGTGRRMVNIDSQMPNRVVKEAVENGKIRFAGLVDVAYFKPEYKYGDSRLDFYAEDSMGNKLLGEIKGVTLEEGGKARFPDAPTERGVKHIDELIKAVEAGYKACIVFVIKMKGVQSFSPNYDTHPEFGEALARARDAGVEIIAMDCIVGENEIILDKNVEIML